MPKTVGGNMPHDDFAIDHEGRPLPYDDQTIRTIVSKAMHEGRALAVIIEDKNGDIAMPVFGPPSRKLLDILEQTTHAYRQALKGF